jgi:hypothetical protein
VASDREGDSNVSGSSQWTDDEVCGRSSDLRGVGFVTEGVAHEQAH